MNFKQFTVASCFSSFMLPHVLFVEELEARKKAVMSCCLAWNISLFPSAEQEDHIERIWQMVETDNRDAPPPGLEQGFKQDLRMLVAQKQELFPWTHTNIPKADLIGAGFHDVLRIATGTGTAEEIEILAWPNPTGLPLIIEHLRGIQSDTAAQVGLLEQARRTPGAFTDIEATQMTTAYCVQRADLVGYQRILTVWRDTQPAPSVKRVICHWLSVLAEIEADTKAVLNILVSCRYCWFAAMECRSARTNAGSFAANAGLRGPSVAVIPGRESAGMLVGSVSNAGHYT